MRIATIRTPFGTRAVRVVGDEIVEVGATDVGELLARDGWQSIAKSADGRRYPLDTADYAPLVLRPGKIVCVGLNYRHHILEMGRDLPLHPTLFAKFADALVGADDPIVHPTISESMDWEAELALVIGTPVRHANSEAAEASIAGFTILNDVTMRDWQYRTSMWLQGKTFERTTPLGPVLVTPDELPGGIRPTLALSCAVDGQKMQEASTADLVFDSVDLVRYVSSIVTLRPGDVIATGTPGGVGHARKPPVYLKPGSLLVTEIEHLGQLQNDVIIEEDGTVNQNGD